MSKLNNSQLLFFLLFSKKKYFELMQGTVPPRILKVSLVALLYTITFDLEPNSEITEKSRNVYIDIDLSLGYCVISVFFLIA